VPMRVLGSGSNLLVRSEGVPGMVIHLATPAFCQVEARPPLLVCGGGARLSHAISIAVREGLAGLEPLVGIPGTVGGALHGNIGHQEADIGSWTHGATVMTRSGEILARTRDDLHFAYRQSSLDELVILDATFQLEQEAPEDLVRRMQKLWIIKRAAQPSPERGAGMVFSSPGRETASELLERAGVKGMRVGQAEVSQRDPNFVVVEAGATCQDVLQLIDLMRSRVAERTGVTLETQLETW